MIEINLLKDRRKKIIQQHQLEKKRNKVAYGVLVGCLAVFVIIQVVGLVFSIMVSDEEKKLSSRQAEVAKYKQVEMDGAEVVRRLAEIEKLIANRQDVGERLGLLFTIFNRGTLLKSVEFGGVSTGHGLVVTGVADSVYDYIDFNDQLVSLATKQNFAEVNQGSLTRNQDATYQFTYEVVTGGSK